MELFFFEPMTYPNYFSSQKEYNSYLNCISKLSPGDKVVFTTSQGKHEAIFLYKRPQYGSDMWSIVVGSKEKKDIFYDPSPSEKRLILAPAKKICPEILIGSTKIYPLWASDRIEKIIKYNYGKESKKEKKEKDSTKKPVRSRRKNA